MKSLTILLTAMVLMACGEQDVSTADNRLPSQSTPPGLALETPNSSDEAASTGVGSLPAQDWIGVIVPYNSVDVVANTGGVLNISVRPGDVVSQGDIVARVDNFSADDELEIAELQMQALEADLEQAEFNAKQEQSLYDRRIAYPDAISRDELDRAESRAKAAAAQWKSAQAAVREQKIRVQQSQQGIYSQSIVAPFAGSVELNYLDSGAAIQPGTPVMRLSSKNAFKIRFAVEPEQASELAISHQVWVSSGATRIPAEIMGIAPFVDIPSQKVFVEAFPLEQSQILRSGLSVTVASGLPSSSATNPASISG